MKYNFKNSTIGDACLLVTDGSHFSPKSVEHGEYMVSVKDFTPYGFDFDNCRQISANDYEKLKKSGCIPQYEDILIGKDGARYFEDIVVYRQTEQPALLSSIAILRCNTNELLPDYLYYMMINPAFKQNVRDNYGSGSAIPRIILKDFKRMPISYPSIKVQQRIISILRGIDAKIELNSKINANLQQQAQAIFKSWFVDFEPFQDGEFVESELGPIPKGWKVISLENVCSVITKGTTPTTLKRRFTDYGINYIKAESISNAHFIDKNKIAYIDQETHELLSRSKIQENDILFTIAGTLGRFCMVDKENVPANTNQAVAIIRADISKIHPCVLYSYFLGDWHTEYCNSRVQQAVQANLSLGTLKNMQIPYPDEVIMEKYRSIVEPLVVEVQHTNRENAVLENLRNALIPKLMNGEIDVEGVTD